MDINCYLVSKGEFKSAIIPQNLLNELILNLRNKGAETVQFADKSIECEGVYIPAKGTKNSLLVVSSD